MFTFPQSKRIILAMDTLLRLLFMTTAYAVDLRPIPGGQCEMFWSTTNNKSGGFGAPPGTGWNCITEYIAQITYVVISFAASIALIMIIVSGFRYMIGPAMPGGSSDAAKKGISAALMGIAVALLAYAIIDTVLSYITTP